MFERLAHLTKTRRQRLTALALGLGSALLFLYILALIIPLPRRLQARDSTMIQWRDGKPAHVFLSEDDMWRVGIGVDEIDPDYIDALLALEDQRFYSHPGVDPIAIGRATLSNIQHGRVVSGASTITMQLVRVLEPRPRTLGSKITEALRAMQLEVRMSKDEILANYLRFVPYGRNIEGVDAASLAYFGHRADALSNTEIATLLAVPQAPNSRYPHRDNVDRLRKGRDEIARELLALGELDIGSGEQTITQEEALEQVIGAYVPESLTPFPREVPHLANWLRASAAGEVYLTTLDRGTQHVVEQLMRERHSEYATAGINNGAAVVVDHTTHEVLAVVGNFDFQDEVHSGQIPGFATSRSTGSLLKPVILAMAMDQAMVHPQMLVPDIPIERADWTPLNFSETFNGLVTLEDALTRSLNIPFITLIEQLRPDNLLALLRRAEFSHLVNTHGHYGLGIAVGGVEATPLEVAGLYAMLANRGAYRPITLNMKARSDEGEEQSPEDRLLDEGSSWLVLQAMAERERPDMAWRADLPEDHVIHWKTGTSNNYRDAWSAGISGKLTAVIWLGNYSNASSPELVGARAAAPLMFDVLEALVPREADGIAKPEDAIKTIEVCSLSGHLPGPACNHKHEVEVPVRGVPMQTCPYHKHIEVEKETGLMTRSACRQGRETQMKSVATFPPEIATWLGASHRARAALPEWAPGCSPPSSERAPEMLLPKRGQTVMIIPGIPTDSQRVPLEAKTQVHGELSWYVDGEYVGSTASNEKLWWVPQLGDHEIVVMDATGRASMRELSVLDHRARRRMQMAVPVSP